jgi:hypothetical protein
LKGALTIEISFFPLSTVPRCAFVPCSKENTGAKKSNRCPNMLRSPSDHHPQPRPPPGDTLPLIDTTPSPKLLYINDSPCLNPNAILYVALRPPGRRQQNVSHCIILRNTHKPVILRLLSLDTALLCPLTASFTGFKHWSLSFLQPQRPSCCSTQYIFL